MDRDSDGPKLLLGSFQGLLQTDGHAGYNKVVSGKMVHACCLANARRKFVDAVKVNPKDADSPRIVALMDDLFRIDREARENNMDHVQRDALRQQCAPHLLGRSRAEMVVMQKKLLPRSAVGQAANYALSFWTRLTLFRK